MDSSHSLIAYALAHPRATAATVAALTRLPTARADIVVSDADDAAVLRTLLFSRRSRALFLGLTSVLEIPEDGASYSLGSSKQTLRRKVRAATQMGVSWRVVDDVAERQRLLERANRQETSTSRTEYRIAQPSNDDLMPMKLWLAAYAQDGEPLLLAVAPVSGRWAALRYFRTLSERQEASDARYLMTQVLVEHLAARRVSYLVDLARPHWLSNGLRHFQRMVGFRLLRISVRRANR